MEISYDYYTEGQLPAAITVKAVTTIEICSLCRYCKEKRFASTPDQPRWTNNKERPQPTCLHHTTQPDAFYPVHRGLVIPYPTKRLLPHMFCFSPLLNGSVIFLTFCGCFNKIQVWVAKNFKRTPEMAALFVLWLCVWCYGLSPVLQSSNHPQFGFQWMMKVKSRCWSMWYIFCRFQYPSHLQSLTCNTVQMGYLL